MRLALALAALMVASPAVAGCVTRAMTDKPQSFTSALLKRMRPLGVRDINRVGPSSSGDHYAVSGATFSLFLQSDGGAMKQVALVLSEPATQQDTDEMLTAAAYTLSRLSGSAEATIRQKLATDSVEHTTGEWIETFGPAMAFFTRSSEGTVVKTGLISCS